MSSSISLSETLGVLVWLAIGSVALVAGATLLVWSPRRTSRALARQRKSLQFDVVLAGEQFDDETVTRLTRIRYRMMGAILAGVGAGLILATLLVWRLDILSYVALLDNPGRGPAVPIQVSGMILGGAIGALIGGAVWRVPAGQTLPPALYQMHSYRQPWYFGLLCAVFLALAAISLLVAIGAVPTQPQTLPLSWSLISIPAVSGALAFAPEVLMRLIVRHPIWPDDLEPALALKAQGAYLQAVSMLFWGYLPGVSMTYLFLSAASVVAPFGLALVLWILTFGWVIFSVCQFAMQLIRSGLSLRAALRPAPASRSGVASESLQAR